MARARRQPQTSLYERELDDPDGTLLEALTAFAGARERRAFANREVESARKLLDERLKPHDLGLGVTVRCGDYLLELKRTPPREVAFVTGAGERLNVRQLEL